eukprot:365438-Chlamydomonas_euryale.AAC.14
MKCDGRRWVDDHRWVPNQVAETGAAKPAHAPLVHTDMHTDTHAWACTDTRIHECRIHVVGRADGCATPRPRNTCSRLTGNKAATGDEPPLRPTLACPMGLHMAARKSTCKSAGADAAGGPCYSRTRPAHAPGEHAQL